jgi:predicted ATP-grasp superfamily ATP-dependent carboligase
MARRVLLVATVHWPSIARLACGFATASCAVDVLSPHGAPVTVSRYVKNHHAYNALFPLASLRAAVERAHPNLLVACDDRAVTHLLRLYESECAKGGEASDIARLIERSLGAPRNYALMMSRNTSMALAREVGIRVPQTFPVASEEELEACLSVIGFPAVLKTDGSWGGDGVVIADNREQAHAAFRRLANPPSRLHSILRAAHRRDAHYLLSAIAPPRPTICVQQFIKGRPAASAFASWRGEVVGSIAYDVVVADGTTGPPNVIRRVDCPEIEQAACLVARRFGLSGLHGLDFIRDDSGAVHLLEINPRATQGGTLPFGPGRDLPTALTGCISIGDAPTREPIVNDVVVLFPREWRRDPASPYLSIGHHDVPWDDPAVLCATIGT